jgi:predicted cupin superfamily sugar epimerase
MDDDPRATSADAAMTAADLIRALDLVPLPIEGGYYRETWRAADVVPSRVLPVRYAGDRAAGTAIYYLLTDEPGCFSALHRLPTDEVYHFYLGDPVEQWRLHEDGTVKRIVLGRDLLAGQVVQSTAPRAVWQGSRLCPGGRFALLGTTMAPGFDPRDYEHGDRARLLAAYPAARDVVMALTRD